MGSFAIALTAISQKDVDVAPTIATALARYMAWLQSLDLVDATGGRNGHWYFVTWGDSDIMTTLRHELAYKSIPFPSCFDRWINLKSDAMYQKHYGHPPTGGLRACFDRIRPSLSWEGRAHNGLVDSIHTAKIVRHMVQTGFRFTRSTRGFDTNGIPFGQKKK